MIVCVYAYIFMFLLPVPQKGYFENRARLTHYGPKNCNVLQIFDRYLYVDYMDEIFIHIRIIPKMRKIRMKRIFLHPHGHL